MSIPLVAGGNISPGRIVVNSQTIPHAVIQATAATNDATGTNAPIGISATYTNNAPGTPWAAAAPGPYVAVAGQAVEVGQVGDRYLVEAGVPLTEGQLIMADANGRAITHTGGSWYVGKTLESCTASSYYVRCAILPGYSA